MMVRTSRRRAYSGEGAPIKANRGATRRNSGIAAALRAVDNPLTGPGMFSALAHPVSAKEETMTRLGSLLFCATLVVGVALASCGGGSNGGSGTGNVTDLVPRDGTIPGWVVDQSISKTSGMVAATATTEQGVTDLIDGAAADFFAAPYTPKNFAWQNYINASLVSPQNSTSGSTVKLYILQMPSADQASGLYTSLLSANFYTGTWTDPTLPTVGAKSRIIDSGTDWWVNFCKGNYYVEVRLTPSYAADFTPSDPGQKKAAMDFAVAIASKI
jgi:hypothetical protein